MVGWACCTVIKQIYWKHQQAPKNTYHIIHIKCKLYTLLFHLQSWRQTRPVSWNSQCHPYRVRLERRWDPHCFPELLACRLVRPHIICHWISICAVNLMAGMVWARQRKEGEVEQFLLNSSSWAWRKDLRSKNIFPHQTGTPLGFEGIAFIFHLSCLGVLLFHFCVQFVHDYTVVYFLQGLQCEWN